MHVLSFTWKILPSRKPKNQVSLVSSWYMYLTTTVVSRGGVNGTCHNRFHIYIPGRVAQSVTCLATDACLTADPGVASSIPARYHTFVEIDHEIISMVILLPSADLFKKGCCQLQAKVCAQITG